MMGLYDGKRISRIRSAVLIQYMHVTDGRTDGIGMAYTCYSIYAVMRKNGMLCDLVRHFPGPTFSVTPCHRLGISPFWLLCERDVAVLVCCHFGVAVVVCRRFDFSQF